MHIADATSIEDHLQREIKEDFYLAKDIPLPTELSESLRFINNSDPRAIRHWWNLQGERVESLVDELQETQLVWDARTPDCIAAATGKLKTVSLLALSLNFNLGGRDWAEQFTYGFPLVGDLSQDGVYPRDTSLKPSPDPVHIWERSQERLSLRAKTSGAIHANELWNEAMGQIKLGWLDNPLRIDHAGNVATYEKGTTIVEFRFGADQADKLRAFDDLRRNTVNLYCTVWAQSNYLRGIAYRNSALTFVTPAENGPSSSKRTTRPHTNNYR